MTTSSHPPSVSPQNPSLGIGGIPHEHRWNWKGKPITIVYEVLGEGSPILMLPALSSVSTRSEMRGLAELLAERYQVIAVDWVGFGQSDRPAIKYTPSLYLGCLRDFVQTHFQEPVVVIAAGHGAGYVMQLAQRQPVPWSWAVLVAPTWRGPLPAAMGEHRWAYRTLESIVRVPLLGQFLYFLNTLPPVLRLMYQRHVYGDRTHITRSLMRQKSRTTRSRRARLASAAFVTGALDPIKTRDEWLSWFQPLPLPTLAVIGEQMPAKSRAEVEILAHFTGVQVHRMPGSLGLHEEYPAELAQGILPFLDKYLSQRQTQEPQDQASTQDQASSSFNSDSTQGLEPI